VTTLEGWAPWHPKHGFHDEYMATFRVSTDLDEIARWVIETNRDEGTNNRNGWRAVRVTVTKVP